MVMHVPRSYTPQTKPAERMILPIAVHKNTREHTFEYTRAEKQTAEKVSASFSHMQLSTSIAYKLKQLLGYFTHRTISLSS